MQNRVEPPVLVSRMMTFVLATALVVLGVLFITIYNMFPLNRPQIFFLRTELLENQEIRLTDMLPSDENLDYYKQQFVREYVKQRNEIIPNAKAMQKKWNAILTMTTKAVHADFARTRMFNQLMTNNQSDASLKCALIFDGDPMRIMTNDANADTYQVKFLYSCEDYAGLIPSKDYTIKLKLSADKGSRVKWTNRIENPLGLQVVGYEVISGDGDPLNMGYAGI